jgi:hypothetical protein
MTASGADFYPLDIVYDKTEDLTLYPVYAKVYNLGSGTVTINNNGYYYIYKTGNASTSNNLRITGGSPSVILDNVKMSAESSVAPIDISAGTLFLTLWGSNSLAGYNSTSSITSVATAAVCVQSGASLVITEYSTGSLNATGGGARSPLGWGAYAASGIGSNGGEDPPACGSITIRGGHIVATGGYANHGISAGGSKKYDPGSGIGGAGAVLNLEGGLIEVASGSYNGKESDLRNPITSLEGGSIDYGDDAVVIEHDGQSSLAEVALVEFINMPTAAMQSMSINGISYPLSGQSFGSDASISVPIDSIEDGCPFVLVTTAGAIYSGTAEYQGGDKYSVTLSLISSQTLSQVTIMASRDQDGTAAGGSVSPYGNQTFPSGTSFTFYAFPTLGYRISHVEVYPPNGTTWLTLSTESYEILDNMIRINTITNGMKYSVVFEPLEYEATVDVVMPNNPGWEMESGLIGIDASSGTASWTNNIATISEIAYNSSLKISIKTYESSGNPYLIKYVTVNGIVYSPIDKGNGVYEISAGSVTADVNINITLAATVKLTFDYSDTLFGGNANNHFNLYDKSARILRSYPPPTSSTWRRGPPGSSP